MNLLLITHYILSIALFTYNGFDKNSQNLSTIKRQKSDYHYDRINQIIQDKDISALVLASNTGNKRHISRKLKRKFKRLYLNHIFTPSGIHLSSLWLFLLPILGLIKNKKIKNKVQIFICTLPLGLEGQYSIQRLSGYKLLQLCYKNLPFKVPTLLLFYLTFLLDFKYGSYNDSPTSFSYSFLFIGAILCGSFEFNRDVFIRILGAQIILCFFNNEQINFLGAYLGFCLTALFSFIFPLLFLFFWSSFLIKIDWVFYFVKIFLFTVDLSHSLTKCVAPQFVTLTLLCVIFFWHLNLKKVACLLFLFNANPILNNSKNKFFAPPFAPIHDNLTFKVTRKTRSGYIVKDQFLNKWSLRIYGDQWSQFRK